MEREADVKRRAAIGTGFGLLITLVGFYQLFISPEADGVVWWVLFVAGLSVLLAGVILPDLLAPLDRLIHRFGQKLMGWILDGILALVYLLILVPTSLFAARFPEADGESSWKSKGVLSSEVQPAQSRLPSSLAIFGYLFRTRQYALIPIVLALVLLGLLFVFLQTSVFAPYIYTLF